MTLAGKTWALGQDAALSSDGNGNWSLTPDVALTPGSYDLIIKSVDAAGNARTDEIKAAIVVAAPSATPRHHRRK